MSVLIKTMTNLPEHCYDCPCHNGESGYCQADKEHRYSVDRPFWCPLVKISNAYYGRLIRFNDIKIITAPIAPIHSGDKVHYEGVAFLKQILEIPPVEAISFAAVEEMKRKIEELNEFSRDEVDEMYMQDVLKIIDECCGIIEADKAESDFEIVSKDAEIDTCYGLEVFHITKEEIAALLSGKKLYSTVNCGEYAITIEMEDNDDERRKRHDQQGRTY